MAVEAVNILTDAHKTSPFNFQFLLHLISWHSLLGSFVPLVTYYNLLRVKHIQCVCLTSQC